MKKALLFLSTIFLFTSFNLIGNTNSYFISSALLRDNLFESQVILNFSLREDKQAVNFGLLGISKYDSFKYKLEYSHDGINEVVESEVVLTSENDYESDWIILGYCSSGGACVYHEGVKSVNLEVDLFKSGVVEKSLSNTLFLN